MDPALSFSVSVLALAISAVTAWLTLFRKGTIKMTHPSQIYLGADSPRGKQKGLPKVYLRTLLFSTAKRGRIVECMHVMLSHNETRQNFNIWVHGEDKLVRGSGLFVGETGVAANHHFLTPKDGNSFQFVEGRYRIEVFARLLGDSKEKLLFAHGLEITPTIAAELAKPDVGLYFDWGPNSSTYLPHVSRRGSMEFPECISIPIAEL